MKRLLKVLILVVVLLFANNIYSQDVEEVKGKRSKIQFVDLDGDGYNDNAPDHDGDGIPNGLDEDYVGMKHRKGKGSKGFVDLDGYGLNDNMVDSDGDGIPNGQDSDYVRPMDGSGSGNGSGICNVSDGIKSSNKGLKRGKK